MSNNVPDAYKGDKSYIFISYAHKDSDIVLPIIERLNMDGYRVWYDEGIASGSNWDAYISKHLDQCSNVLCFLSKSYVKSQNCKDELAYARIKGKPINIVYIDDVELSAGMKMRYGRIQALFMRNMSEEDFYKKLYDADIMANSKE